MCGGVDKSKGVTGMGRNQLKADDELGFLQAITDEWNDLEMEYRCLVTFSVLLHPKRGHLMWLLSAFSGPETDRPVLLGSYRGEYPNHSATRLHAAIYHALIRLGVDIRDRQRQGEWSGERAP